MRTDLLDKLAALQSSARGNPRALLVLARTMRKAGEDASAIELCREAVALAPDNPEIATQAQAIISATVPSWHFGIVKDVARNRAYDAALRRAVSPTSRVLEIGTGTGLLAMMAARAGAAQVVTCEQSPAIAECAARIIAANGFADRVRVIPKHSDELDVDHDLGGRADILVSEIISNDMLGEEVLSAHSRAVRDLLKPGSRVIPMRGSIRIALAEYRDADRRMVQTIDGFDLSPFNALSRREIVIGVGKPGLQLRGDPVDLFTFDFAAGVSCQPGRAEVVCHSSGGRVNGIVQWIAIDLDEVTHYENRPAEGATSCWAARFHLLPAPVATEPGHAIRVYGSHNGRAVTIWTEP